MRVPSVAAVQILKVTSPGSDDRSYAAAPAQDLLAVEEPLEILLVYGPADERKQKSISVTMCTPGHEEELAAGFLFTEGIIQAKSDIQSCSTGGDVSRRSVTVALQPGLSFDPQKMERHFYTSSSCGVCGKSSLEAVRMVLPMPVTREGIRVGPAILTRLPQTLRIRQEVFEHTGGLHASAFFDTEGELLIAREDVGRHNALDKLIGASLLTGYPALDKGVLLLSGRASFELIQKAAMAGIQMVCAVGAPSSLAVELARECGMTLVGFLRDGRFNIYGGEERIGI